MLATILERDYKGEPCAVVALSEGGVMVAAQVAIKLRAVLGLLLVEMIALPQELDPIGAISEKGDFAYNSMFSAGQIEEMMIDYRGYMDDQRRSRLSDLHRMMGKSNGLRTDLLHDKHIFLVSDGLNNGFSLEIALESLKTVVYRDLIVVTPIASPEAVDRMHVLADKIYCLSVVDNYLSTEHYYERKDVPARADIVKIVDEIAEQLA